MLLTSRDASAKRTKEPAIAYDSFGIFRPFNCVIKYTVVACIGKVFVHSYSNW